MQFDPRTLAVPIALNAGAIALALTAVLRSGFFPGAWASPPDSTWTPHEASADAEAGVAAAQGGGSAEPGVDDLAVLQPGEASAAPAEASADDVAAAPASGSAAAPNPDSLVAAPPTPASPEPAPAPAPGPDPELDGAPAAPAQSCAFRANDMEVGRAVRRRRAARTEQPFVSEGLPFFAWIDVNNRDEAITAARVRWIHEESGHTIDATIEMRVGNHWQVIVEQILPATLLGTWRIEVLDTAECIVIARDFETTAIGWERSED